MRPRGPIAQALVMAAHTPATVRELCERAQVGTGSGFRTASRLVEAGELLVLGVAPQPPGQLGRPASVVMARRVDANSAPVGAEPPASFDIL